ncbi:MAG: hypothetical protein ABS904_00830 [Solibacillus isronensis]
MNDSKSKTSLRYAMQYALLLFAMALAVLSIMDLMGSVTALNSNVITILTVVVSIMIIINLRQLKEDNAGEDE